MSIVIPGGFELTDQAIELCKFQEGAKILDIGCGEGDTCLHLQEKYGFQVTGIDTSPVAIEEGLRRHPYLDLKVGHGDYLEGFPSDDFDGVMMECVLSLTNMPEAVLRETYRILKKGGKLILSDLYRKDAGPELIASAKMNADRVNNRPKKFGECDEYRKERPSAYRVNNVLLLKPLTDEIEQLGFVVSTWEDKPIESMDGSICRADKNKNAGYFLMLATKPFGSSQGVLRVDKKI